MIEDSLTYDFYCNEYNANTEGIIPLDFFNKYCKKAWRMLETLLTSQYTEEHLDAIGKTVCEIAEELYVFEGRKGIKSESVDGYSVTYADEFNIRKNIVRIAIRCLGDTGLLYLGVD